LIRIYVDADGCPVKNEVFRVAKRYGLRVTMVANATMRLPQDDLLELVVVDDHFDAADNWIVTQVKEADVVITADIPLAARSLEKGARVLGPKGRVFSMDSIGDALANRELMKYLRDLGNITGGPAPFGQRDRSRFLQSLDALIQTALKAEREAPPASLLS
jgi:uncharacterized protein YaiI (UPF0178 family)